MTGVANARVLGTTLEREVERCRRYGRGLAVLLVDIDATERLNLQHGPDAGDLVIRGVADLLRSRSRKVDTVARRLGSQFAMVLPEADEGTAARVAETIRALVAEQAFMFSGQRVGVTVTVGVATAVGVAASVDAVCAAALQALAEGKLRGRNCVVARRIATSDPA
jgi:diguanylate cyclase (GGDEF)-like protein